jgi:hypothetical protein
VIEALVDAVKGVADGKGTETEFVCVLDEPFSTSHDPVLRESHSGIPAVMLNDFWLVQMGRQCLLSAGPLEDGLDFWRVNGEKPQEPWKSDVKTLISCCPVAVTQVCSG